MDLITDPKTIDIVLMAWLVVEQIIAASKLKSNSTVQLVKSGLGAVIKAVFRKK